MPAQRLTAKVFYLVFCLALLTGLGLPARASLSCEELFQSESLQIQTARYLSPQFLRTHDLFAEPSFYENLSATKVNELIDYWYGGYARRIKTSFLEELSPTQLAVLLDPGVATRLPQFLRWAETRKSLKPFELRQGFAQSLGSRKVFRGMLLRDDQVQEIRSHGIIAQGLNHSDAAAIVRAEFTPGARSGFISDVEARLRGRALNQSLLISVTRWIEATSAGAWRRDGTPVRNDGQFYLFEIEVPEISVLRLEDPFRSLNQSIGSWKYFVTKQLFSDRDLQLPVTDPDFEMFIFGSIPPEAIRQIHRYEQMPARWWPADDTTLRNGPLPIRMPMRGR